MGDESSHGDAAAISRVWNSVGDVPIVAGQGSPADIYSRRVDSSFVRPHHRVWNRQKPFPLSISFAGTRRNSAPLRRLRPEREGMSSFCMGCGNSLSKDERYCGICGRDSQAQAAPVDPSVAFGLPPETSGKAIFSLVTGFLFFFLPFAIVSLVFGYLSLYDIRKSAGQLTGRGLAITGIVLGYLGVVVTIGVIALGIYSMRSDRREAMKATDESSVVSSVRTLNAAEISYARAHPQEGFSCSLSDLSKSWGIDPEVVRGKKNGFVFELESCEPAKKVGPIAKYRVVAYMPVRKPGVPAYCSDESDVIRVARNGSIMDCLKSGVDLSQNEVTHPKSW